MDSFHESSDGKVRTGRGKKEGVYKRLLHINSGLILSVQVGYDLKEEIEKKFDKWQEPPPVKTVKPLPAPLDGQRKKRGGRRCLL